jgi:biopolymer transport protein ExbB/TolQ
MLANFEHALYGISQLFLFPVLLAVAVMFLYAFYAVGAFLWQVGQRRRGDARGFELIAAAQADPRLTLTDLEAIAVKRMELPRIVTRITPMLGLVATMIPMGPALKSLADGQLQAVSQNLMVAFSAVVLALIAAALTYWVVNVRRRWYATELAEIEKGVAPAPLPAAATHHHHPDPVAALATEGVQ